MCYTARSHLIAGDAGIGTQAVTETFDWPDSPPPIAIVGPTATGKTDAALRVAEKTGGEIINCDSMQVYRGMDIGTAKPSAEMRARVPFHLLDMADPDAQVTVAEWKRGAEAAISDIVSRGKRPILCGGTGMYLRALLDNWSLAETPADEAVRADLRRELETVGAAELHEQLRAIDPVSALRLHPNDGVRITRALEVFRVSGRTISAWQADDRTANVRRPVLLVGLDLPRAALNERIERRVDAMIAAGLVAEVQSLLAAGYNKTHSALRSLGYKEITEHLEGALERDAAVVLIKQNTRRYAKRQQTWFRAEPGLIRRDVSDLTSAQVAEEILFL